MKVIGAALCCWSTVLFLFVYLFNYHIQAVFLCNCIYGPQEKKNRKKQTQLFWYRVEPVTTLVSCVASQPSAAVLGSSDGPPGAGAAVPAETGAQLHQPAVICANLNLLCLLVSSGLIPLLCLHWFHRSVFCVCHFERRSFSAFLIWDYVSISAAWSSRHFKAKGLPKSYFTNVKTVTMGGGFAPDT